MLPFYVRNILVIIKYRKGSGKNIEYKHFLEAVEFSVPCNKGECQWQGFPSEETFVQEENWTSEKWKCVAAVAVGFTNLSNEILCIQDVIWQ